MCHMLGFILFWLGIGMTIMFFIHNTAFAVFLIILCIFLGYQLFCH